MPLPSSHISNPKALISGQEALFACSNCFTFNGQERCDEITGTGNHTTALFGEYYMRLGWRWNVDPKPNHWESHYSVMSGKPVWNTDVIGYKWKTVSIAIL